MMKKVEVDDISDDNVSNFREDSPISQLSPIGWTDVPLEDQRTKNTDIPYNDLPEEFTGRGEVKGFLFKKIHTTNQGNIYAVIQPGLPHHYEVIRRTLDHRYHRVGYPGSKSFSISGWTARTLEDAYNRFKKSIERDSGK